MEVELAVTQGLPESSNKLAAEKRDGAREWEERTDRVILSSGCDRANSPPAGITQWTWDGVQVLTPGVQHGEEAEFRADVSGGRERLREEFPHWRGTADRR